MRRARGEGRVAERVPPYGYYDGKLKMVGSENPLRPLAIVYFRLAAKRLGAKTVISVGAREHVPKKCDDKADIWH